MDDGQKTIPKARCPPRKSTTGWGEKHQNPNNGKLAEGGQQAKKVGQQNQEEGSIFAVMEEEKQETIKRGANETEINPNSNLIDQSQLEMFDLGKSSKQRFEKAKDETFKIGKYQSSS